MVRRPPKSTRTDPLFPYTTRFRSGAVAQLVYAHGANLVLADLDHAGLEAFAHGLGGDVARRVAVLRMDAANPDDAQKAVDVAQARFGGIDHLVPSVGLYLAQPVQEMPDARSEERPVGQERDGTCRFWWSPFN